MIDGSRVRQARELHRWTQGRLVEEVHDITQPRLSKIESGQVVLDSDTVAAASLAAALGVTLEWLTRPPLQELNGLSPHFRARARASQGTKAAGLAWAELVNEAHVRLADRAGDVPVTFRALRGPLPVEAAALTRQLFGFDAVSPLPYLIYALEQVGVRVLALPWRNDAVDAFCGWAGARPTVVLSADVPGDRRRWTTAHELGHLLLHDAQQQGKDIEAQADAFAAELLTPLEALQEHMPSHPTLATLSMLKTQWGVSVKSLIRRARELGRVDDERAVSLYRQISARGWNKSEPGFVALERPRALRRMVESALPGESTSRLATEMGWSLSLAEGVLAEHARSDELPTREDSGGLHHRGNVVPLRRR